MIVFNNANSLEASEAEGEITIEIDPVASDITEITEVEISTIDGTARSTDFTDNGEGLDFTALDRLSLEIDPDNPDTFSFTIDLTEDAIAEPEENFQFRVRAVDDLSLSGTETVTIFDDGGTEELEVELAPEPEPIVGELLPSIAINDIELIEGNSGITNFEFTVSLSAASDELVTVDYVTADSSAETTAIFANSELADAADYIADSGTIAFAPGETEQTLAIEVLTDTESLLAERESETFFVDLLNQNNANIADFRGTGTIVDDDFVEAESNDLLPIIQLEDADFDEGDSVENIQQLTVNLVDRNGEAVLAPEDISFSYSTVDISAAANLDYKFVNEETAVIESGESSTAIGLTIIGDEEIELNESLTVVLADLDPELAQFDGDRSELEAVVAIQDDDGIADSEAETESDDTEAEIEIEENAKSDDTEEEIELEENEENEEVDNNDIEEETEPDDNEESEGGEIELSDNETEETEEIEQLNSDNMQEETEETELNDIENDDIDNEADEIETEEAENDNSEEVDVQDNIDNENASSGGATNIVSNDVSEIDSNDFTDNTVLRFLNADTGGYLYTASESEIESITSSQSDFEFETASFVGVDRDTENAEDVYRYFNTRTEAYFYTASEIERDFIEDNLDGFIFEDVAFSAFEINVEDSIPVYRFFDGNTGVHFYTADEAERTFVEDNLANYDSEGIAFYALPVSEMM